MALLLRLGEADWKSYFRGDEWFTYDIEALMDLPSSKLLELEDAMAGLTVHTVRVGLSENSALSLRGAMFIARWLGGVREEWAAFDPAVLRIDYEAVPDEPDPTHSASEPQGSSPE